MPRVPVHPRTGGEHVSAACGTGEINGSSPHGRGTLVGPFEDSGGDRFIPARAGNTCMAVSYTRLKPVHPRTGGEHSSSCPVWIPNTGSSPHGRGTPVHGDVAAPIVRFIPARAGNTCSARSFCTTRAVHPRTGGEHMRLCASLGFAHGSSPHGRGTRRQSGIVFIIGRFIPARAGNTVA